MRFSLTAFFDYARFGLKTDERDKKFLRALKEETNLNWEYDKEVEYKREWSSFHNAYKNYAKSAERTYSVKVDHDKTRAVYLEDLNNAFRTKGAFVEDGDRIVVKRSFFEDLEVIPRLNTGILADRIRSMSASAVFATATHPAQLGRLHPLVTSEDTAHAPAEQPIQQEVNAATRAANL